MATVREMLESATYNLIDNKGKLPADIGLMQLALVRKWLEEDYLGLDDEQPTESDETMDKVSSSI